MPKSFRQERTRLKGKSLQLPEVAARYRTGGIPKLAHRLALPTPALRKEYGDLLDEARRILGAKKTLGSGFHKQIEDTTFRPAAPSRLPRGEVERDPQFQTRSEYIGTRLRTLSAQEKDIESARQLYSIRFALRAMGKSHEFKPANQESVVREWEKKFSAFCVEKFPLSLGDAHQVEQKLGKSGYWKRYAFEASDQRLPDPESKSWKAWYAKYKSTHANAFRELERNIGISSNRFLENYLRNAARLTPFKALGSGRVAEKTIIRKPRAGPIKNVHEWITFWNNYIENFYRENPSMYLFPDSHGFDQKAVVKLNRTIGEFRRHYPGWDNKIAMEIEQVSRDSLHFSTDASPYQEYAKMVRFRAIQR